MSETVPPVITEAIQKCGEIDLELTGLKSFLQKVSDPWWEENDPGYTRAKEMYESSKGKLAAKVAELPDVS